MSRHVVSTHPLKMGMGRYLLCLPREAVLARLGGEAGRAFLEGRLDIDGFVPPPPGEGYTIEDLKRDDMARFGKDKDNISKE